jgi:hypothetical protein
MSVYTSKDVAKHSPNPPELEFWRPRCPDESSAQPNGDYPGNGNKNDRRCSNRSCARHLLDCTNKEEERKQEHKFDDIIAICGALVTTIRTGRQEVDALLVAACLSKVRQVARHRSVQRKRCQDDDRREREQALDDLPWSEDSI